MSVKEFFEKLDKSVTKVMFDEYLTCNLCGEEVFDGEPFCEDCDESLHRNDGTVCACCGRKTANPVNRCFSCGGEWAVDKARSAFLYDDGAEKLIKALKYGNKRYLAKVIAPFLKNVYVKNMFAPDFITFVPMSEKAIFTRGYNQAELLAKELAKLVDNRVIDVLVKSKETPQQERLSAEERKNNLLKCFKVTDKAEVKGKDILLVDDVLTTGATSHAIAKKLKKAGAKSVTLLTIASVSLRNP